MNFIIGQIISVISLIISSVCVQFKKLKHVLLGEMLSNTATALSFVFLGGLSGAWICIVAALQTWVMYLANKHNVSGKKRNFLTVIFAAAYIAGTAYIYQGWNDVVSCTAALLYVMAIMQKDAAKHRLFMAMNSMLWIIYDLAVMAFVNVITHGTMLASLIIAMIRLDLKKRDTHK